MNEQTVMTDLHNNYALSFGDHIARMLELEWYPLDDPFTHGNELQHRASGFYIHRTGKLATSSYKAGTYCGIDLCMQGGMLIRAIQINDEVVEGPCLVVRKIAELTGWDFPTIEQNLRLIDHAWTPTTPIFGPRGGLTLKNQTNPLLSSMYLVLPRRSAIINIPTKYRECWFAANINRTDIPTRSRTKYQQEFLQGYHQSPHKGSTILQCAGYWAAQQANRSTSSSS